MMRALWTGASGMIAQQTSLDNIANNLSNVNTTGYKKEMATFESLLYSKLQTKTTDRQGNPKPVIGQVGSGVRVSSIISNFEQGSPNETGNVFDMMIDGNGFFSVRMPDGTTAYTRNGAFRLALQTDGTLCLANSEGCQLLDINGEVISFRADIDTSEIVIDDFGNVLYPEEVTNAPAVNPGTGTGEEDEEDTENGTETANPAQVTVQMNSIPIGLAQFNNPAGLLKISGTLFQVSEVSGAPRLEATDTALKQSKIISQYLESSNVKTADEIVNLIVTQRAYEMNSKVIQASDEMLQQANNLRS